MRKSNNGINNTVGATIPGSTNTLVVTNPSDSPLSASRATISVGGGLSSNPTVNFNVGPLTDFEMGIDNSDSDSFKISASDKLGSMDSFVMTTCGARTLPLQPMFFSYLKSTLNNKTGDGTHYVVICDCETVDQGEDYNVNEGIFTAPISGNYYLYSGFINPLSYKILDKLLAVKSIRRSTNIWLKN